MFSFTSKLLPPEMLGEIFEYLDLEEKYCLSFTNKEWRAYFENSSWVWNKLDFGFLARKYILIDWDWYEMDKDVTGLIQFYLSKAGSDLYQLYIPELEGAYYEEDDILKQLQHCRKLTDLTMNDVNFSRGVLNKIYGRLPNLKRLCLNGDLNMTVAVQFLQNSLKLESACFSFICPSHAPSVFTGVVSPTLKSLEFLAGTWSPYVGVSGEGYPELPVDLIKEAINLERLVITYYHEPITTDYRCFSKLQKLQICYCRPISSLFLSSSITELDISLENLAAVSQDSLLSGLKKLTLTYRIPDSRGKFTSDLYKAFRVVGDNLKKLHLRNEPLSRYRNLDRNFPAWAPNGTEVELIETISKAGKTANVTCLVIYFLHGDSPADPLQDYQIILLDLAATVFPKLRGLRLWGYFRTVTDSSLREFCEKLPGLKKFQLGGLGRAFNSDMRQWMADRDVLIQNISWIDIRNSDLYGRSTGLEGL